MSKKYKEYGYKGYKGPVVANPGTINSRFPEDQAPDSARKPRTFRRDEAVFPKPGPLFRGLEPAVAEWLERLGVEPSPGAVKFALAVLAALIAAGVTSQAVVAAVGHDMSSGHNFPSSGHAHRPGISNPNNAPTLQQALHQLVVTATRKNNRQTAVDAGRRPRVANAKGEFSHNGSNSTTRRRHRRRHRRLSGEQIAPASPVNSSLLEGEQAIKMTDDSRTSKGGTRIMSSGAQTAIDAPVIPGGEGPKDKLVINPQGPTRDLFKHMIPLIVSDMDELPPNGKPYLFAYGPTFTDGDGEWIIGMRFPVKSKMGEPVSIWMYLPEGLLNKKEAEAVLYAAQIIWIINQNLNSREESTYSEVATQLNFAPTDIAQLITGVGVLRKLVSNLRDIPPGEDLPFFSPHSTTEEWPGVLFYVLGRRSSKLKAWRHIWSNQEEAGAFLKKMADVYEEELHMLEQDVIPQAMDEASKNNQALVEWFEQRQERGIKADTPGEVLVSVLAMLVREQEEHNSSVVNEGEYSAAWASDKALKEVLELAPYFDSMLKRIITRMYKSGKFPQTGTFESIRDLRRRAVEKIATLAVERFKEQSGIAGWPDSDIFEITQGLVPLRLYAPNSKELSYYTILDDRGGYLLWHDGGPRMVNSGRWENFKFRDEAVSSVLAFYKLAAYLEERASGKNPEQRLYLSPERMAVLLYILGMPEVIGGDPSQPPDVRNFLPPYAEELNIRGDLIEILNSAARQVYTLKLVLANVRGGGGGLRLTPTSGFSEIPNLDISNVNSSELSLEPFSSIWTNKLPSYRDDHGGALVARIAKAIRAGRVDLSEIAKSGGTSSTREEKFDFRVLSPEAQAYLLLLFANGLTHDYLPDPFYPLGSDWGWADSNVTGN